MKRRRPPPRGNSRPHRPAGADDDLGVPIPGQVLAQEAWTQTALKRLPEPPLDWPILFGRAAPRIVDLGCGNGRFAITSALARPECDHLAIDILPLVLRYATRRANQRGLTNVRFAAIDAERLVERYLEPHSVDELHLYHPQPYYDPAQVHRRLIKPDFLLQAHRVLRPGGLLLLQTDHPGYWRYIREVIGAFFEFEERYSPWPDAPRGRTRREIMARSQGLPIFRGVARARVDLDEATALARARALPPPVFEADRRLLELDRHD